MHGTFSLNLRSILKLLEKCDNLTPYNSFYVKNSAQNKAKLNQTIILPNFTMLIGRQGCPKKRVETSPNQFLSTKYQISKHLGLLVLLESFLKREGHTGQNLHYF